MSQDIKLKRLCQKGPASALIRRMVADWNEALFVLDAEGGKVFGEPGENSNSDAERHPIELAGQPPLGWVGGGPHAPILAGLLAYIGQKELESKSLAQETLGKYKELTLLYELGEKITACLDIPALAQLTLTEARRLLPSGKTLQIGLLLADDTPDGLAVCAGEGGLFPVGQRFEPLDGITGQVLDAGNAEIVNDVAGDARYQARPGCLAGVRALLCLPLRTNDRTFGLLVVATPDPVSFQAADLKVLNVLASQAAMALGRVQLIMERVEQERLQESLKLSRSIQMGMLSTDFPRFAQGGPVDLYAFMEPAREVGGDLYDFFYLDEHTLLIAIGDVSDKGVPAALFMVMVKTLLRVIAQQTREPRRILDALNPELCRDNHSAMFVTLFLATLDIRTGQLIFGFGGHNPPVLLRRDGSVAFLVGENGVALGIIEGLPYSEQAVTLAPGDGLLLYTDGVTEAMSPQQEIFTEDKLSHYLAGRSDLDAQALVETVLEAVRTHAQGAEQSDDITMLGLRLGSPSNL
ncbi:PP2C family protein-serine/threonine phosphatase [Methylomagnum sp.]